MYTVLSSLIPWAAAAMGTGIEVENIKDRPLDCTSFLHLLLSERNICYLMHMADKIISEKI